MRENIYVKVLDIAIQKRSENNQDEIADLPVDRLGKRRWVNSNRRWVIRKSNVNCCVKIFTDIYRCSIATRNA